MSDIQKFAFRDQIELEIHTDEAGGFRISAPQVARALGFREAFDLLRNIPDNEKGSELVRTPGGDQVIGYLTEPGFYRALGQRQAARIADPATRQFVEDFQTWVYGTVIPSIRRTGSYTVRRPQDVSRKEMALMIFEAEEALEHETAARLEAENHARALEPGAAAWDVLGDAAGDYGVGDAAKVLSRDPAINTGRDRLFLFMESLGWVYRDRYTRRWKARQTQVSIGRLVEKVGSAYERTNGDMHVPDPTIRITPKGLRDLHGRFGGGTDGVSALG